MLYQFIVLVQGIYLVYVFNTRIMRKTWKLGELFCGPGGFAEGARKAGFRHVWAVDNHYDSCQTFAHNQKMKLAKSVENNQKDTVYKMEIEEFVKKDNLKKLEKIDGLIFGFPCNDFSNVGKKKEFKGKYGGLYRHACLALDFFKPKFFVAENVTSIAKDGGYLENFNRIMKDLAKSAKGYGYRVYADSYKFEEFNIPQTRHRVILAGFRDDFFHKKKIKYAKLKKSKLPKKTCGEALSNIPENADNHEKTNHSKTVIRRLKNTPQGKNVWDLGNVKYGLPGVKSARMSHIYKKLDRTKPSYTVTGSGGGGTHVYHFKEPRALTNRERARLQTFKDTYFFKGSKESIRRQIGMAVPVDAARQIMLEVKMALENNKSRDKLDLGDLIHNWMIKANGSEIYYAGKLQTNFDF